MDETQGPPPVAARLESGGDQGVLQNVTRLKTIKRILNLIDTMMVAHDKKVIERKDDVVRIGVRGYQTTQFELSDAQRKDLAGRGWDATAAFLRQKGFVTNLVPSPYR